MAICDNGSTLSFVDKSLRDQLDVPENSIPLNIAVANRTKEMVSEKVRIKVTTPSVSESVMFHVHHSKYPESKLYNYNDLKRKYSDLDVFPNDKMDLKQVKIVLGQDNYPLLFPVAYRKGKRKEPWAVKTKLRWTLSGPLPKHELAQLAATSHVAATYDGLGAQIKTWFSMESNATQVNVSGRSREKKRALEQLEKTTRLIEGRCEVGLTWVEYNATFQNNYFSAHSQFCFFLERRLEKDESLKQRYEDTINVDLQNGYVRKPEENWVKRKMKDSGMYRIIQSSIPTNSERSGAYATQ